MFDIDPPSPVLRLDAPRKADEVVETAEIVDALAHDPDVLELLRMLCTAAIDRRAALAQAQPISAVRQSVGDGAVRYERPTALEPLAGFQPLDAPL